MQHKKSLQLYSTNDWMFDKFLVVFTVNGCTHLGETSYVLVLTVNNASELGPRTVVGRERKHKSPATIGWSHTHTPGTKRRVTWEPQMSGLWRQPVLNTKNPSARCSLLETCHCKDVIDVIGPATSQWPVIHHVSRSRPRLPCLAQYSQGRTVGITEPSNGT